MPFTPICTERLVSKIELVCSFCPGGTEPGTFTRGRCVCMAEMVCAQRGLCRVLTAHQVCCRLNLARVAVATEICGGRNGAAAPENSGNHSLQRLTA